MEGAGVLSPVLSPLLSPVLSTSLSPCVRLDVCVRASVRVRMSVRACVRACVCARERLNVHSFSFALVSGLAPSAPAQGPVARSTRPKTEAAAAPLANGS